MDFGVDEELNYEEDLPEDDSNDSENKDCGEDDMKDSTQPLELEDQYLRIDYSEDENLVSDETLQEEVTTEPDKVMKGPEGSEASTQDCTQSIVSSEKKDLSQSKKLGENIFSNKSKRRKRLRPFQRRAEFKKKIGNALSFSPWLPECNFTYGRNLLEQRRQLMYNNQMLNLNQDFYTVQNSVLPQLMTSGNFVQSRTFSANPAAGIGINNQGFPSQRNNPIPVRTGQPLGSSNYQTDNGKVLFSGNFGYQSIEPEFIFKGNGFASTNIFDRSQNFNGVIAPQCYVNNFQINNATRNGLICGALCSPSANAISMSFAKMGVKNVQYKSLEEDEKKALMLKKEARLKRFMHDGVVNKDKPGLQESLQQSSPPKVLNLQKKEEKVHVFGQQKENSLRSNDREGLREKPDINKESLLRKINPFDANLVTTNKSNKVEQKNETVRLVKEERIDSKAWTAVPSRLPKPEMKISPSICTPAPVKTETEPPVRFVRTISKTFDELTCRKLKTGIPSEKKEGETLKRLPPVVEADRLTSRERNFPKQLESQLTGCIVKVLNIPPSTTTNDILALCSPIGIVMEVKLNFPKENSVVIRFAEPTCAENFFSLYHGQKMNNYFLNVIVV